MKVSKGLAKKLGVEHNVICDFHEIHPDLTAMNGHCQECIMIDSEKGTEGDEKRII